jgi:glucose/arabinose dehydrogenase
MGTVMVAISCGKQIEKSESTTDSLGVATPPVETKKANADYKPAFEGQTRVAGVKTTIPYGYSILDSTLNRPWGIAELPGGKFIVTEKDGTQRSS